MTAEEFDGIAKEWLATSRHPKFNRPYTDLVYQPMVELLAFLRANDFETFIVSGGGIEFMRTFSEKTYGVPPHQVVGSSIVTKYEVRDGGRSWCATLSWTFTTIMTAKPVAINKFTGRRPIARVWQIPMAIFRCSNGSQAARDHVSHFSFTTKMPSASSHTTAQPQATSGGAWRKRPNVAGSS
jgi:hypothetical protein